jgi:hypothetical protein
MSIVSKFAALIDLAERTGPNMSTQERFHFEVAKRDAFRYFAETMLRDTDDIREAEKIISAADQAAAQANASLTEAHLLAQYGELTYKPLDSEGRAFAVTEDGKHLGTIRVEGPSTVAAERQDGHWVGVSTSLQSAAVALAESWKLELEDQQ